MVRAHARRGRTVRRYFRRRAGQWPFDWPVGADVRIAHNPYGRRTAYAFIDDDLPSVIQLVEEDTEHPLEDILSHETLHQVLRQRVGHKAYQTLDMPAVRLTSRDLRKHRENPYWSADLRFNEPRYMKLPNPDRMTERQRGALAAASRKLVRDAARRMA